MGAATRETKDTIPNAKRQLWTVQQWTCDGVLSSAFEMSCMFGTLI